ncbi:MAG: hypothetical protein ABI679_12355 [Gemmatimonadota bacterium]
MRRLTFGVLLSLAPLAACARPVTISPRGVSGGSDAAEAMVTAVIYGALESAAAGSNADSLYTSSAVMVVNGRTRSLAPLYAGISSGGQVSVTSSQLEIRNGISWSLVSYRWEMKDTVAREGQATFVLTQDGEGRWKIQHAHSSSPL